MVKVDLSPKQLEFLGKMLSIAKGSGAKNISTDMCIYKYPENTGYSISRVKDGKVSTVFPVMIPKVTLKSLYAKGLIKQNGNYFVICNESFYNNFVKRAFKTKEEKEMFNKEFGDIVGYKFVEKVNTDNRTSKFLFDSEDIPEFIYPMLMQANLDFIIDEINYFDGTAFKLLVKIIKNKIVGAVIYTNYDTDILKIEFVEVNDFERGEGIGLELIREVLKRENVKGIEGCVKNNYSSFCFWNKVGKVLFNQEIEVEEQDLKYLNDEDYNLEYDFRFENK